MTGLSTHNRSNCSRLSIAVQSLGAANWEMTKWRNCRRRGSNGKQAGDPQLAALLVLQVVHVCASQIGFSHRWTHPWRDPSCRLLSPSSSPIANSLCTSFIAAVARELNIPKASNGIQRDASRHMLWMLSRLNDGCYCLSYTTAQLRAWTVRILASSVAAASSQHIVLMTQTE